MTSRNVIRQKIAGLTAMVPTKKAAALVAGAVAAWGWAVDAIAAVVSPQTCKRLHDNQVPNSPDLSQKNDMMYPNPTRLGDKQKLLTLLLPRLLDYAHAQGYDVTLGDGFRDPRVFGALGIQKGYGRAKSLHKARLAIDLNLFKDGAYCTKTEDHKFLGEYWESLHPLCTWGGRFNDGNHYSITHKGLR